LAEEMLRPFFAGDALTTELSAICKEAFDFPIPLVKLKNGPQVLELFHGPTCAFKDVGAQFLAACMARIPRPNAKNKTDLVLVATSGDTGGAVAAAFSRKTKIRVAILYPKGKISSAQEQQLTCWGDQVTAFSVLGDFDDCQKIVKAAFQDAELQERFSLISANSISLGRLLPQMVYYAGASLQNPGDFIVPTGNLGNAMAAYWAKQMGFPIGKIHFALNANTTIRDFLTTGQWVPHPTVATLANAMDVGNASNAERLRNLFPNVDKIDAQAIVANDKDILLAINKAYDQYGYISCPHTATAFHAYWKLGIKDANLVATAHPAKFLDVMPKVIAEKVTIPEPLAKLAKLPSSKKEMSADLASLKKQLS
jgi:threonine synthase